VLDQNHVRQRLIAFQSERDYKWKWIANKISVPVVIISEFKNSKKDLWDGSLENLDKFLSSEGY
jgi:hypothetical protein